VLVLLEAVLQEFEVRRCPALVPVTAVTKNPTSGMTCFCIWLRTACSMPGQLLSRGVRRVSWRSPGYVLEGLLLFGVMAGEELSTILSP